MSNLKSMLGGIVEDTNSVSDGLEKLLAQYPVGTGSYAVLDVQERSAEAYFLENEQSLNGTVEGGRLQSLLGKVRVLLASERDIASMQQIKGGQSTVEEETKRKAAYEAERGSQGLTFLTAPPEEVTPVGQTGGGILTTILLLGAAGAGAYFLLK